jgi:endoglucanase
MIAGIGLNEGDFRSNTQVITLADSNQTYTLNLTATFGGANSRVLFDMGADVGVVVIDNVSLTIGEASTEVSAPTTPAPTPPARNAADVISLFSDAYTNVNVSTFATEWSEGTSASDVEVAAGDMIKLYNLVNFAGIQLENAIDLTGFTRMHFDFWIADATLPAGAIFSPKLSNHAGLPASAGETSAIEATNPVSTAGEWVSFDVALDDFTAAAANGLVDRENIYQILLAAAGTIKNVYIDNLYFYRETGTNVDTDELPTNFVLNQNYPNPFNPTTTISYSIPTAGQVQMDVFNLQGQRVATLVNRFQSAGSHVINFDASNLASGVYTYRLMSGNNVLINKMTLIK